MDRVRIFDTTLRDGEQSPGATLNRAEKLEIARQLARLGVDIVEAGFPVASPDDFAAVREIAETVEGPVICGLARAIANDVERCWEAVRVAPRPRIHVFMSTSDIHLQHQFRTTRQGALDATRAAVAQARAYTEDVEFSPMDATRTERDYLLAVIEAAVEEGATTLNIPDTVGFATPEEYGALIKAIREGVRGIEKAIISVHCHDDLGMAVANSLAGIANGARQVECTINGIGERAGNAALEEIVMALRTRGDAYGLTTGIDASEIYRTSRLVSARTGVLVQPNKAIVGSNAFAHESGIHQDGVLKERSTYEIMDARDVGLEANSIVLGKHSGRHALARALRQLGFELDGQALNAAFRRFKEVADRKKQVTAMDLEALVADELRHEIPGYQLEYFEVEASSRRPPHATVGVRAPDGAELRGSFTGDGPIDAIFRAINAATGIDARLREFRVDAVTGGQDALGETSVVLEVDGAQGAGQGVSTDIIEAAARAYVLALSNAVRAGEGRERASAPGGERARRSTSPAAAAL